MAASFATSCKTVCLCISFLEVSYHHSSLHHFCWVSQNKFFSLTLVEDNLFGILTFLIPGSVSSLSHCVLKLREISQLKKISMKFINCVGEQHHLKLPNIEPWKEYFNIISYLYIIYIKLLINKVNALTNFFRNFSEKIKLVRGGRRAD